MSTRAIIGIKNADGTITGAWQWNDGGKLTRRLNTYFNTFEKAKTLISVGMWSSMFTLNEKIDYQKFLQYLDKRYGPSKETKIYRQLGEIYLLQEQRYCQCTPEVYKDYAEMAGQDINHTYLFDTKTCRWVRDKDIT